MNNNNRIVVYDFETDGKFPHSCSPVQLGAQMLNPRTLEVIPGSEFNIQMCPPDINEKNYEEKNKATIQWHADLKKTTPEAILATWRAAPSQKVGWNAFNSYLQKYNNNMSKPSEFGAPIAAGFNIIGFDNIISNRMRDAHETKFTFNKVYKFDLMDMLYVWFENDPTVEKMSLDYLRGYFGIPNINSHDALQDVKDTTAILVRLMKLHRTYGPKLKFKDSFTRV